MFFSIGFLMVIKLSLSLLMLVLMGVEVKLGEAMLDKIVTGLLRLLLDNGLVMILIVLPDKVVRVLRLISCEGSRGSMSMSLMLSRLSLKEVVKESRRSTPGPPALKQVTLEVKFW